MVGVGGGVAEEEPELLAAATESLGRAPQALVGLLEELGDVEILLPGLGRREIVAVLGLEGLLVLRVVEQVDAVGIGMQRRRPWSATAPCRSRPSAARGRPGAMSSQSAP